MENIEQVQVSDEDMDRLVDKTFKHFYENFKDTAKLAEKSERNEKFPRLQEIISDQASKEEKKELPYLEIVYKDKYGVIHAESLKVGTVITDIDIGKISKSNELVSIVIPEGVEEISTGAFQDTKIETIQLPTSLTVIGERAFYSSEITNLEIPEEVTKILDDAFTSAEIGTIQLPTSLTVIGESPFYKSKITNLEISEGVTKILDGAFTSAEIGTIQLPTSLRIIDRNAFRLSKITNLEIPEGVEEISTEAFALAEIGTIQLPTSLRIIDRNTFRLSKITNLEISEGVEEISTEAFALAEIGTIQLPTSLRIIDRNAFRLSKITNLEISEGVTKILDGAFTSAEIGTIQLPTSLTVIGESAFYDSKITNLEIPEGVTKILDGAFREAVIGSIKLPVSLTTIGNDVFKDTIIDGNLEIQDCNIEYMNLGLIGYVKKVKINASKTQINIQSFANAGEIDIPIGLIGENFVNETFRNRKFEKPIIIGAGPRISLETIKINGNEYEFEKDARNNYKLKFTGQIFEDNNINNILIGEINKKFQDDSNDLLRLNINKDNIKLNCNWLANILDLDLKKAEDRDKIFGMLLQHPVLLSQNYEIIYERVKVVLNSKIISPDTLIDFCFEPKLEPEKTKCKELLDCLANEDKKKFNEVLREIISNKKEIPEILRALLEIEDSSELIDRFTYVEGLGLLNDSQTYKKARLMLKKKTFENLTTMDNERFINLASSTEKEQFVQIFKVFFDGSEYQSKFNTIKYSLVETLASINPELVKKFIEVCDENSIKNFMESLNTIKHWEYIGKEYGEKTRALFLKNEIIVNLAYKYKDEIISQHKLPFEEDIKNMIKCFPYAFDALRYDDNFKDKISDFAKMALESGYSFSASDMEKYNLKGTSVDKTISASIKIWAKIIDDPSISKMHPADQKKYLENLVKRINNLENGTFLYRGVDFYLRANSEAEYQQAMKTSSMNLTKEIFDDSSMYDDIDRRLYCLYNLNRLAHNVTKKTAGIMFIKRELKKAVEPHKKGSDEKFFLAAKKSVENLDETLKIYNNLKNSGYSYEEISSFIKDNSDYLNIISRKESITDSTKSKLKKILSGNPTNTEQLDNVMQSLTNIASRFIDTIINRKNINKDEIKEKLGEVIEENFKEGPNNLQNQGFSQKSLKASINNLIDSISQFPRGNLKTKEQLLLEFSNIINSININKENQEDVAIIGILNLELIKRISERMEENYNGISQEDLNKFVKISEYSDNIDILDEATTEYGSFFDIKGKLASKLMKDFIIAIENLKDNAAIGVQNADDNDIADKIRAIKEEDKIEFYKKNGYLLEVHYDEVGNPVLVCADKKFNESFSIHLKSVDSKKKREESKKEIIKSKDMITTAKNHAGLTSREIIKVRRDLIIPLDKAGTFLGEDSEEQLFTTRVLNFISLDMPIIKDKVTELRTNLDKLTPEEVQKQYREIMEQYKEIWEQYPIDKNSQTITITPSIEKSSSSEFFLEYFKSETGLAELLAKYPQLTMTEEISKVSENSDQQQKRSFSDPTALSIMVGKAPDVSETVMQHQNS